VLDLTEQPVRGIYDATSCCSPLTCMWFGGTTACHRIRELVVATGQVGVADGPDEPGGFLRNMRITSPVPNMRVVSIPSVDTGLKRCPTPSVLRVRHYSTPYLRLSQ